MKRWLTIFLNLISLLLFGLVLWWGGPEAWQELLRGDPTWLLIAFVAHGAAGMVSAWRLRLVAHAVADRELASWRHFYHLSMTARALGLVLPRSLSTLGGKSVGLRAMGVSLRRSLWIVMVDNVFDVLLLTAVALPAIFFLQGPLNQPAFLLLCGLSMGIAALGAWWGTAPGRLDFLWRGVRRVPWLAQRLKLTDETAVVFLPPPPHTLQITLLTLLLNAILAFTAYAIAQTIQLPASWLLFLAIFPIAQLSLIIAIAPGGLGIFDLGWIGLLLLSGVPETGVQTFVIAQRAYVFIFVLIWAGVSALLALTTPQPN